MAKSPINLDSITEPIADPTVAQPEAKPAALDLPKAKPEVVKHKVSPRKDWEVKAIVDGQTYGPFRQTAVDESEAVTRLLDNNQPLKKLANRTKFRVKPVGNAA